MTALIESCASQVAELCATGWRRVFFFLIGWLVLGGAGHAIAADPTLVEVIPVKGDRTDAWPDGDWIPIRGRELSDLVERSRPQPKQPRKVWIERATYSATFDANRKSLRGGRLTADVRHDSSQGEMLSLEPLNLAISEMSWVDQPAVCGTLRNGQSALYVDGKQTTLVGRWNLTGRKLPRSVEFEVQLPIASVNRIRLIIPDGYYIHASTGESRWIELKGKAGLRQWELDLGSQTQCRLTIRPQSDQVNVKPAVLCESTHSYVVREDGVQLQAEFLVEAANAPINVLLFTIPAGIDIYSVSYGGIAALAWRLLPDAEHRLLAVQLADPLLGTSRPIRIAGTATPRVDRNWQLPQPQLRQAVRTQADLRTMRDEDFRDDRGGDFVSAAFLRGDLHLKIESPLELQAVKSSGLRQTSTVSTPDVSRSYSYQQYLPDAKLMLSVGMPELRRRVRLLSYVDTSDENWSLTSHVDLSTDAGQTFEAKFQLAPMWEVIEVRPRDDASRWTDWNVRRQKGGRRVLTIEFRDAIAPGMPKAVEVVARRLPLPRVRPLRLPFLRPLNHRSAQQVIAIARSAVGTQQADTHSRFRAFSIEEPPKFVVDSELWQMIETTGHSELLLLRSDDVVDEGELPLGQLGTATAAEVWTTEIVDLGETREIFEVRLQPSGEALDRVLVYLSVAGEDVEWKLDSTSPESLSANRISRKRHGDWKLPSRGELWEIQLPRSYRREVHVIGTRTRSNSSSLMATLATVPRAEPFLGVVALQLSEGVYVNAHVDGPVAVEPDALNSAVDRERTRPLAVGRVWRYQSPRDSLQLRLRSDAEESQLQQTAVLKMQSILSDEFPGYDRHRATFTLQGTREDGEIRFELPLAAELLSTRLNGKVVTPYRRDNEWVMAHPSDGRPTIIQVVYQSSTAEGHFIRRERIPLPKCAYTILDFQWEFATPPDTWVVGDPGGVVLLEGLPQLSWTERFFGPLGRPIERAMFNPFSSQSWSALRGGTIEDSEATSQNESDKYSPAGWKVYRASSLFLPDQLTVVTRRHSQAWLLSWVGTLWCLLCGLLMRFRQSEFRKSVFGYWLSICLFTAWLSPPFYALIAGGCVVGTVVALLFPRRLLERLHFKNRPVDIVPAGSTASIRRLPVATLLLFAVFTAAQSFAQPSPGFDTEGLGNAARREQDGAVSYPIRVLSTRDESEFGDQDVVYVEGRVLKKLRSAVDRIDSAADYVISSAKYAAAVDDDNAVVVSADYVVYLLPGVRAARVGFPNTRANPGRCRVNGKAHPIVLGEEGPEFFVELVSGTSDSEDGGLSKFEISLDLRPATQAMAGEYRYRLNTVAVASAELHQQFSRSPKRIAINGSHGEQLVEADRRSVSALIGKSQFYQVVWSENSERRETETRLEAAAASHVIVRPTWLETHYRIQYRVLSGQVDFVAWNLPHGAETIVVRNVALDEIPVESFLTTATGEQTSQILVEFAEAQTNDFVVEAVVVHPLSAGDRGVIPLTFAAIVDDSAQTYEVTQTRNLLAITAPPEFEINSPAPNQLDGGLRPIEVETFTSLVGEMQAIRPVRMAFEVVSAPSQLLLTLTPMLPVRKVRSIQTGTIRSDVLQWTLTADLETSKAPVFLHQLHVPTQLSITEISVREDDAERLVHWARQGDVVELFLSDKSSGNQSLLLSGELRVPRGRPVVLPLIHVKQADVTSARLRLLCDPGVSTQLLDMEAIDKIDEGLSAIVEGEDLEFIGQYRVLPEAMPPRISVVPRSDQMQIRSAVRIERHGQLEMQIDYRYEFLTGQGGQPIEPIRMKIPADIAERIRVESADAMVDREVQADGSVELQVSPSSKRLLVMPVRVVAIVDEPPPGDWVLPRIEVNDDEGQVRYLSISKETRLQPVGRNIETVSRQSMPEWLGRESDVGSVVGATSLFRVASGSVSFFVGLSDRRPKASRAALVETQIVESRRDAMFGRTTIWITHLRGDEFQLNWPRKLTKRAVVVDGIQSVVVVRDRQSNRISIPVATGPGPHRVDIHWSQTIVKASSRRAAQQLVLPSLYGMAVNRTLLKIVPPNDVFYSARDQLTTMDEWTYALDRLQGLYEVNKEQATGVRNRLLWDAMQGQRELLLNRLASSTAESASPRDQERFDRISSSIDDLETSVVREAPATEPVVDGGHELVHTEIGNLSAPNRSALLGRIVSAPADPQKPISFWTFGNWVIIGILLLIGSPLILVIRWMVGKEIGQWLFRHQPVAWALLGLLWWTCLRPSEFGLVLVLVAVCVAIWERRRVNRETEFVVDISADDSESLATSSP